MFNKDIYLKVYADNSWELYNKNSLEICSESHSQYLQIFRMVFSFKNYSNLLIIGGGDFQLATEIGLEAPLGSSITIVDPVIHSYTPFVKYYVEDLDQIQLQDSLNHSNVTFNCIESIFSAAYPKLKNNKYEKIVIDCSEEINLDTFEIYKSKTFIKQLHSLLSDKGLLYIYIPPKAIFMRAELEKYFRLVDSYSKYIDAWKETATFYEYIKV